MASAQEKVTLLMIKGAIYDMPKEEQDTIATLAQQLRNIVKDAGAQGVLALALVGAEVAAED